jgi:hypothetical protein
MRKMWAQVMKEPRNLAGVEQFAVCTHTPSSQDYDAFFYYYFLTNIFVVQQKRANQRQALQDTAMPKANATYFHEIIKHMHAFAVAYEISDLAALLNKQTTGLSRLIGTNKNNI